MITKSINSLKVERLYKRKVVTISLFLWFNWSKMAKGLFSGAGAVIFVIFISRESLSGEAVRPRGVRPELASLYDPSRDFQCLDGSNTIGFDHVNDDYCDCQDGSDEPGTSACSNAQFYCPNRGYKPTLVRHVRSLWYQLVLPKPFKQDPITRVFKGDSHCW